MSQTASLLSIRETWISGLTEPVRNYAPIPSEFEGNQSVYSKIRETPDLETSLALFLRWVAFVRELYFNWEVSDESAIPRKSAHVDFASLSIEDKDKTILSLKNDYLGERSSELFSTKVLTVFPLQRLRVVKLFDFYASSH